MQPGQDQISRSVEGDKLLLSMPEVRETLKRGIDYLLQESRLGFREGVHYLNLPRMTNTSWEVICYPTGLFPRMLVLDSLLDARELDPRITERFVQDEIQYIKNSKHKTVTGGWNYVPSFPDLPPDADDLGFALQLLLKSGGKNAASICDDALNVLFKNNLREDGSFSTWIIDKSDESESNKRVLHYTSFLFGEQALVPGGGGAHLDVISNLLYALALYDAGKHNNVLDKGARYLESHQNPEGYWESKWYWSPYYTTFRSISLLSLLSRPTAIRTAIQFVLRTQLEDGSWGENMDSGDDLNTALALLCLLSSGMRLDSTMAAIVRGAGYLKRTATADGSWHNVRLVKMVTTKGSLLYGSQTATTSFCVKVLARLSKLKGEQAVASG